MGIQNFYLYKDELIIEISNNDGINISQLEKFINRNESRINSSMIIHLDKINDESFKTKLDVVSLLDIYKI